MNYPPWYEYPALLIQDSPFPADAWELPVPPVKPRHRNIFHQEGCTCPQDPDISGPGPADYKGIPGDWCDESRRYAIEIRSQVSEEFNLLFATAQGVEDYCKDSQELWRVYHYGNLPCNAERTTQGTTVGQLLHPVVYDILNIDCLRWQSPNSWERTEKAASRIIPVIIEHYLYKTRQYGPRGIAPRVPGSWGFPLPTTSTIVRYAHLVQGQLPFEYPLQGETVPLASLFCSLPTCEVKDHYAVE
jgi:hypothetical protein